jgi:acylphosphatase
VGYIKEMVSGRSMKRLHVLYSGHVQGVGFRYTVCHVAAGYNVTGVVRNLWDGDVEMIAEGLEADLDGLLNGVRISPLRRHITDERVNWSAARGEFDKFGISY